MGDQEVLQEIVKELKRIANALEGRYAESKQKDKVEIKNKKDLKIEDTSEDFVWLEER